MHKKIIIGLTLQTIGAIRINQDQITDPYQALNEGPNPTPNPAPNKDQKPGQNPTPNPAPNKEQLKPGLPNPAPNKDQKPGQNPTPNPAPNKEQLKPGQNPTPNPTPNPAPNKEQLKPGQNPAPNQAIKKELKPDQKPTPNPTPNKEQKPAQNTNPNPNPPGPNAATNTGTNTAANAGEKAAVPNTVPNAATNTTTTATPDNNAKMTKVMSPSITTSAGVDINTGSTDSTPNVILKKEDLVGKWYVKIANNLPGLIEFKTKTPVSDIYKVENHQKATPDSSAYPIGKFQWIIPNMWADQYKQPQYDIVQLLDKNKILVKHFTKEKQMNDFADGQQIKGDIGIRNGDKSFDQKTFEERKAELARHEQSQIMKTLAK